MSTDYADSHGLKRIILPAGKRKKDTERTGIRKEQKHRKNRHAERADLIMVINDEECLIYSEKLYINIVDVDNDQYAACLKVHISDI